MKPYLMFGAILTIAGLSACAHPDWQNTAGTDSEDHTTTTLNAYHWTMNRAVDADGRSEPQWIYQRDDGTPVTLTFNEQRLAVAGLCNSMGASYTVDGTKINISQAVSTMKMCADESLMRYEQAFGQRLQEAAAWHITRMDDEPAEQPSLTLRFEDDAQWVLTGIPTAETLYGGTGEIIFFEVAAQRVPCSDPLIPNRQCLNVRTIEYDASGLKQGHGPWEPFYGYIDKYEHTPGVRNVLRVKRYTRQDVPADASRYAYVLDMIVEQESP